MRRNTRSHRERSPSLDLTLVAKTPAFEKRNMCQMNRLVNDGGGGAFYAANNVQIM